MTTPFEWVAGTLVAGIVTITAVALLGPVRRRDPLLLIGTTFVALRLAITIGSLVVDNTFDGPMALITLLVVALLQRRWLQYAPPVHTRGM